MIPKNAVKKFSKPFHRDIAVSILISYGIFPQTNEGIEKAKKLVASKEEWLAPSNLPNYYDGIESDIMTGKETAGIIFIRNTLKEFYGISSTEAPQKIVEKVEVVKPEPVQQPEPEKESVEPEKPKQVNTPVFTPPPQPPSFSRKKNTLRPTPRAKTNKDRWGYLTGYELDYLEYYTRDQLRAIALNYGIRNASRMSGPQLISLIKSDEDYQKAKPGKVDTPDTPTKAKKPLQRSGKKIYVEGGKGILYVVSRKQARRNRLAKLAEDIFAELADEKSFELEEDEAIEEALEESKEVELVTTVKLPKDLNFINAKYTAGQHGLYDLEFESDIDRAIYFAGKQSKDFKESPTKDRVREWLAEVTHLDYNTSFGREIIFEYRKKIVEKIRELIKEISNYLIVVPEVYDGEIYSSEEDADVNVDEIDTKIEDDIEELNTPSEEEKEDKSIADNITKTIEGVVGDEDDEEDDPMAHLSDEEHARLMGSDSEEDLGDVKDKLVGVLNKTKKQSSYTSNKKIFDAITANFGRIQSTLDSININLQKQNALIKASIDTQLAIGELISNQTQIFEEKFDVLLRYFEAKTNIEKEKLENEKKASAEDRLESQIDVASTKDFVDVSGRKQGGRKLFDRLARYFGKRIAKGMWRRFVPRKLRAGARLGKRVLNRAKNIPRKFATSTATKITTSLGAKASEKVAGKAMQNTKGKLLERILSSKQVHAALARVMGKEAAEKLAVKIGAKLIPGVSTAYGISEGIARMLMGDVKGGFLSFGSAIPIAGYGFAAVDIIRDIDTNAYTKHIEPNLPNVSDANIAAFFAEALGVVEGQHYESGTTETKKGSAMLHGLEIGVDADKFKQNIGTPDPMSLVAGVMIESTRKLMASSGTAGKDISQKMNSTIAQVSRNYDIQPSSVQVSSGGSFMDIGGEIKKIKKQSAEDELKGMEKDLLETQDPESFANKLLKMIDPEGKFQQLLKNLPGRTTTPTIDGEGLMAEGGYAVESSDVGDKFLSRGGKHKGIDIASARFTDGTPISIIKPGVVADVGSLKAGTGDSNGWGNFVVVKHDDGLYSLYGHLKEINVSKGQRLEPSSAGVFPVIGKIGSTGRSSGAHLHLEVGTGWTGGVLTGHRDPLPIANQLFRGGGNVKKIENPTRSPVVNMKGLGKQGAAGNRNFGATSGVGSKGYLIVPGHAAGGGAPEEKRLVKQLARNTYNNVKAKFPDANVHYQDTDGMFEETDDGFKKQLEWFKQKEKEGWEILEVHMDASMESGQGTGRGVIAPTGELNPVEAYFAQNYGAFPRGHRDLGAPKRGVGLFELGNMSPELQQASKQNKVSKQQLDALTAPLERAIQSGLNISPPSSSNRPERFQSLQGKDGKDDTKFLIINQPSQPQSINTRGGSGVSFTEFQPGRWKSNTELSTTLRNIYIQRLGQ